MRVRDVSTEGGDSGESNEKLRERRFQEQFGPIEPVGSPKKSELRKGDPKITFVEAVRKPQKATDASEKEPETRVSRVKFIIIISINIKIEARDASIERRDRDAGI